MSRVADRSNVHDYYLAHAYNWAGRNTLKTDAFNEAFDRPVGGIIPELLALGVKVTGVEYDSRTVEEALRKYPEMSVVHGDIRELPFGDSEFDSVLDLSTLDHVLPEDVDRAISEYARVLQIGGRLMLICWYSLDENEECPRPWEPTNQYHFDLDRVRSSVLRWFSILEEETFYVEGQRFLNRMAGVKWRSL